MLRLGIDREKPYRATFIYQDGLCCCNMALISFRLFRKNLGNLRDFFGQMVYRPPWQKISRTPMLLAKLMTARCFPPPRISFVLALKSGLLARWKVRSVSVKCQVAITHIICDLKWCYMGRLATTIFSATQRCNIVATLFRMVPTLFQHCNAVLR